MRRSPPTPALVEPPLPVVQAMAVAVALLEPQVVVQAMEVAVVGTSRSVRHTCS